MNDFFIKKVAKLEIELIQQKRKNREHAQNNCENISFPIDIENELLFAMFNAQELAEKYIAHKYDIGAREYVQNSYEYKVGKVIVEALRRPALLFQLSKRLKEISGYSLSYEKLVHFYDADEGVRVINHKSYKIGTLYYRYKSRKISFIKLIISCFGEVLV